MGVEDASHSDSMGSLAPALWAGRQAGGKDRHSDQLLVRGFLPYRLPWGTCEVRGAGPNLWFAVAKALGFRVTLIRCPYLPFVQLVLSFCPGVSVLSPASQRFTSLPELVFLDVESLPSGPGAHRYWERWLTPHVFYAGGQDADSGVGLGGRLTTRLPPGWTAWSVTLSHCSAGGATLGVWSLVAWYPPFFEGAVPLPVVAEMWFPLWCYVNDREQASPHQEKLPATAATASVVRSDGLVQLCGLFPASDRSARVLVPATSSPSGLGSRVLTLSELGCLWDIPISVMDSLVGPTSGDIYRAIFDTPPTKTLLVGADSLLTTSFRGGLQKESGILGVTSQKRAEISTSRLSRKRTRLGFTEISKFSGISTFSGVSSALAHPALPGPSPRSDQDLGLTHPLPLVTFQPTFLFKKGDAQKADDASVPDQLWLGSFASGYGGKSCLARHRSALGMPLASPGGLKESAPSAKGCGWEEAMTGFRTFGLRHWRRQLIRGFYRWRRENVPLQARLPTPSQM